MDFITGLPPSGSTEATNCMVITDRLTKGVILIGIRDTTAEDVTQAFFTHFYIYHGLPLAVVSDRGPQFVSAFWRKVYERLSIQRRLSTAFHPQTDSATERANQEIERILRVFITYAQDNWKELLPIVAVAINNRDAASTGISPFFFTHGYHVDPIGLDESNQLQETLTRPELAGETFVNRLQEATDWAQAAIASAQAIQEEQTNRRRQAAPIYKKGDWVWLNLRNVRTQRPSKKLDWLHGRYKIVEVPSPYTVRLDVPTGIHPVFHTELVRPAATDPFPSQIVDDTQPPPLLIDGEEEYGVDRVLAVRRRKVGRGYRNEALVQWTGWAEQTWQELASVQDCAALDVFEEQYGPVSDVIRRQTDTGTHVVAPLGRLRLEGGYCHGPMPVMGHANHVTLAC